MEPARSFLENSYDLDAVHWDPEPTSSPSQEGSGTSWPVPLLGGVRGGLVCARFMESSNLQVPSSKKSQVPNSKIQRQQRRPEPWSLGFGASLVFGAWSLEFLISFIQKSHSHTRTSACLSDCPRRSHRWNRVQRFRPSKETGCGWPAAGPAGPNWSPG